MIIACCGVQIDFPEIVSIFSGYFEHLHKKNNLVTLVHGLEIPAISGGARDSMLPGHGQVNILVNQVKKKSRNTTAHRAICLLFKNR